MSTLRVIEPFACDVDGVPHVYRAGDLVSAKDKVVKGRERFFVDAEVFAQRASVGSKLQTSATETATAGPGEKRGRRAPSRRASKKATPAKKAASNKPAADTTTPEPVPEPKPTTGTVPAPVKTEASKADEA